MKIGLLSKLKLLFFKINQEKTPHYLRGNIFKTHMIRDLYPGYVKKNSQNSKIKQSSKKNGQKILIDTAPKKI